MPATIVQRNTKRIKKVKIDTVTIDIIESALRNARFEMDTVLFRTAMSPGIREQHDEFPMIANLEGKMVVGQFGSFIWGFMQGYDGTIEEGDVFLTNDPYSVRGAISHANDWLMLMPIYRNGRLIAWAAMFGHMTDVGGKVPGSLPTDARTIYEEGVTVPPVKIFKKGVLNEDVLKIMLHNCRLPHWNLSDFNAIVAALRTASTRCIEISERFGDDVFYSAMDEMLERNKRAMRELILRTVPEKKQRFEDYICDDGLNMGPYKIACTMWREGNKCIFDFAGTDPQSTSSINFLLNEEMFKMFAGVYMIMVFDPQILFNDGFYDFEAVEAGGSVVPNPRSGAHFRYLGRAAWPRQSTIHVRCGILRLTAFHVLRIRQERGLVPALSDHLRRHPGKAVWRWARRTLAVAGIYQRTQRIPRELFSAADRYLRDHRGHGWPGEKSRRQRVTHRLPIPGTGRNLHP
jgi:N-methylhydantoinase B